VHRGKFNTALLAFNLLFTGLTWPLAFILWAHWGETGFAISVFLLGLSLGPCLAGYSLVSKKQKQRLRHLVLLSGGLSIMAMSLLGSMNLELEGFFMLVMAGTMGAAIGHTIITVIAGPLVFGRFLCGWGCWRAMVLEFLPPRQSHSRRMGLWNLMPLAGLTLSIGWAALSVYKLGHHPGGTPQSMHGGNLLPVTMGFVVYYLASLGLGILFDDQRAFCKYLCPSSVILRQSSRFSLVKMAAQPGLCNQCGACSRSCPMDLDVARFIQAGRRVASGECILCQRCAHACPKEALHLTFGFDIAGKTLYCRTDASSESSQPM
jgi:ferredoxin-type protein NapH